MTGVGVLACRHGHVYHAVNCTEGERHAYAILCFQLVLAFLTVRVACFWYDIACRCADRGRDGSRGAPHA